jgi:hypothetical protein
MNMRTLILIISLIFATSAFAAPMEIKRGDLQKADGLGQLVDQSQKAVEGVDSATRIGLVVQTDQHGPRGNASVVVLPTDPEWAAVSAAVKSVAARRKAKAEADLTAIGVKVMPDPVEVPIPARPARGGP